MVVFLFISQASLLFQKKMIDDRLKGNTCWNSHHGSRESKLVHNLKILVVADAQGRAHYQTTANSSSLDPINCYVLFSFFIFFLSFSAVLKFKDIFSFILAILLQVYLSQSLIPVSQTYSSKASCVSQKSFSCPPICDYFCSAKTINEKDMKTKSEIIQKAYKIYIVCLSLTCFHNC